MRVAAAIAATLTFVALPLVALGHAELVSSDPPAGGTLTRVPYTLTATFDDELTADGSSIVIESATGTQVAAGTVSAGDAHVMTADLPALPDGEYTVRWTAVSADDAAVERGSYSFNVGAASATGTPATPTPPPSTGETGSNDVLLAIGLAAILIAAVIVFVVLRGRR